MNRISKFLKAYLLSVAVTSSYGVFPSLVLAGTNSYNVASKTQIAKIEIVGNKTISTEKIRAVMQTKCGTEYDRDSIRNDLSSISQMGYFDDASILAKPELSAEGNIILTIMLKENPKVNKVLYEGNSLVDSKMLEQKSRSLIGLPRNLMKISELIDRIERHYRLIGSANSRVTGVSFEKNGKLTIKIGEYFNIPGFCSYKLEGQLMNDLGLQKLPAQAFPSDYKFIDGIYIPSWTLYNILNYRY